MIQGPLVPLHELQNVFEGKYNNFQSILTENKEEVLDINSYGWLLINNERLAHLAKALKETPVKKVILCGGVDSECVIAFIQELKDTCVKSLEIPNSNISYEDARKLGLALKCSRLIDFKLDNSKLGNIGVKVLIETQRGSNLTSLSLDGIVINNQVALDILALIPHTHLGEIRISPFEGEGYTTLTKAVKTHHEKLILTPYYALALGLLPKKNNKCEGDQNLIYAGGILKGLPQDLRNHIVGFLPLMRNAKGVNQAAKYLKVLKDNHPNGLAFNEPDYVKVKQESQVHDNEYKCIIM